MLQLLWDSDEPMTVAQIQEHLNKDRTLAYTTVMTVLDRLAKRDLVNRERVERAWQYTAKDTQAGFVAKQMSQLLADLTPQTRREALRLLFEELDAEDFTDLARELGVPA